MGLRTRAQRAVSLLGQLQHREGRATAKRRIKEFLYPVSQGEYSDMQRAFYDKHATDPESARRIVHPDYERASRQTTSCLGYVLNDFAERRAMLEGAGDIAKVRKAFQAPVPTRALDFGCGVGRYMEELVRNGFAVDGVDISKQMIGFARQNPLLAESRLFVSGGADCGDAPSGEYDLVFSTLCMQHICCRSIRAQILTAIHRVLRDGGMVHIQFQFYPTTMAANVPAPHVAWSKDQFAAKATNSGADVWITPDQLHLVWEDFGRVFRDLRFTFIDFPRTRPLYAELYARPFGYLLVSASKGFAIADRIYRDREPQSV